MSQPTPRKLREADARRLRKERAASDAPHGTAAGYTNWACRCEPCREAKRLDKLARKARAAKEAPHGTYTGYGNWGCRCEACQRAGYQANSGRVAERTLATGALLHPPVSLPYRALARTCLTCGNLVVTPLDKIYKTTPEPNCRVCKKREQARSNSQSLATATRAGYPWTGPELETVARTDLTGPQVAVLFGRSLNAVRIARSRLRHDPKTIDAAGLKRTG